MKNKLEKKYAPTLDNYGQSCFVRSDLKKIKCVCKTFLLSDGLEISCGVENLLIEG
jgi:hypothetical protein